jgi:predicted enzyme related to lactoylglutathione lyase
VALLAANALPFSEVAAHRARLEDVAVAHGAEVVMSPVTMPGGLVELAQFRDPEGNWVGLVNDQSLTETPADK